MQENIKRYPSEEMEYIEVSAVRFSSRFISFFPMLLGLVYLPGCGQEEVQQIVDQIEITVPEEEEPTLDDAPDTPAPEPDNGGDPAPDPEPAPDTGGDPAPEPEPDEGGDPAPEPNTAPVASLLSGSGYFVGDTITVDGSQSQDADLDSLQFNWRLVSQPANSNVVLQSAGDMFVQFVPDRSGAYLVELTVHDGQAFSQPANVVIDVAAVANEVVNVSELAPSNYELVDFQVGGAVYIDRSYIYSSIPTELGGMTAIQTANASKLNTDDEFITFVIDNSTTVYVLYDQRIEDLPAWMSDWASADLTVSSTDITYDVYNKTFAAGNVVLGGNSGPQTSSMYAVVIDAQISDGSNSNPVANAGNDVGTIIGQAVVLSGISSSDPDGDTLTYDWAVTSRPNGSIALPNINDSSSINFSPDEVGVYVLTLTVTDTLGASHSDSVTVLATLENMIPTADAGDDETMTLGASITLSATESSDPEGALLNYSWSLISSPAGSVYELPSSTNPTISFTPDVAGEYLFALTVNDGAYDSFPVDKLVQVLGANTAPSANAGENMLVGLGATVVLLGNNSSDPDGDGLTYDWSFVLTPGSAPSMENSSSINASFTPADAGDYIIQLSVSDGQLTDQDTVSIQVVDTGMTVAWDPNTDSPDGYIVYASENIGMDDMASVATLASGDDSWNQTAPSVTLSAGVLPLGSGTVCFAIAAYNIGGQSALSDPACVSY